RRRRRRSDAHRLWQGRGEGAVPLQARHADPSCLLRQPGPRGDRHAHRDVASHPAEAREEELMILLNPTDDRMQWAVGVHAPYVNVGEEAYFPPQQFAFEPGEPTEVPDAAVEVLLEHLGPRGLVRCGLQDDR